MAKEFSERVRELFPNVPKSVLGKRHITTTAAKNAEKRQLAREKEIEERKNEATKTGKRAVAKKSTKKADAKEEKKETKKSTKKED